MCVPFSYWSVFCWRYPSHEIAHWGNNSFFLGKEGNVFFTMVSMPLSITFWLHTTSLEFVTVSCLWRVPPLNSQGPFRTSPSILWCPWSLEIWRQLCSYDHIVIFSRNPRGYYLYIWPLTCSCVRPSEMLATTKWQPFSFSRKGKYVIWGKENKVYFFEKTIRRRKISKLQ